MTEVPTPQPDAHSYSYRPSLMGAGWQFHLTADGLAFEHGRRSGHVPYRDIRRVRLSYKPISMQTQRYLMEIWADGAKLTVVSSSWKSMVEQVRQDQAYSAFAVELHRRLAGMPVLFEQGRSPFAYWPGLAIFVAVVLGFVFMIFRALQTGTWAGAAFIAAFLALLLWHGGRFFQRNRPGVYTADAPPDLLLPKG
jgi:hypothetical protein